MRPRSEAHARMRPRSGAHSLKLESRPHKGISVFSSVYLVALSILVRFGGRGPATGLFDCGRWGYFKVKIFVCPLSNFQDLFRLT